MTFKTVAKIIGCEIAWSDLAKQSLRTFKDKMNGKVIEIKMRENPKDKTTSQHNFLWLMISSLGKFLGSGDLKVFEDEFKESIGMFEFKEVKNLKTGEVTSQRPYISIASLNFQQTSEWIERGLALCDEMHFPMRALYEDWKLKHKGHKI